MLWKIVAMLVCAAAASVRSSAPASNATATIDVSKNGDGVCKADYDSRYNIDSKELGTTCINNRVGPKPVSMRLRQALDKMKQGFQQLQDAIALEASASVREPAAGGSPWERGSILNIHREYPEKEKILRFGDSDESESRINQGTLGAALYGEPGNQVAPLYRTGPMAADAVPPFNKIYRTRDDRYRTYDDKTKRLLPSQSHDDFMSPLNQQMYRNPAELESALLRLNSDQQRRNSGDTSCLREQSPKQQAFETQRVLADIRLDPELAVDDSAADVKQNSQLGSSDSVDQKLPVLSPF